MTHFGITDEITPPVVQLTQSMRKADTFVNFNLKLEALLLKKTTTGPCLPWRLAQYIWTVQMLTQGSLSPWVQGQGKWENKSSAVPGHHASMVNPPANKVGEGSNMLMHQQRRKDFRRVKSTQDWRSPTLTFKTGWFCLRATQRKGALSDK